ncbi:phage baseplate assembly protein [Agrobacterium leguminum]|uniref:phage baseplate assembly protein n=1 Tax=Agrobacterium leguminum TaxID=2792015 RepID=UPI003CE44B40
MAKSIKLLLDGAPYDQWTSGEVTRDLKDFSGSFSFTFRDGEASKQTLAFASMPNLPRLHTQMQAKIMIGKRTVLIGHVETVAYDVSDGNAAVTISGRDKTGDLIDCSALAEGPAELKGVKLEAAASKIAEAFGLKVRTEVDTGDSFDRYSIDLGETAFSAIEKGARQRSALILSDGVGNIVITRTGKTRAPDGINLPGNVIAVRATESTANRFSKTVVRGQSERSGKARSAAALDGTAEPIGADSRNDGDGSARERERKGTVATGTSSDDEIKRYRPVVHLARSKAGAVSAQDEADWRNRTSRAEGDEQTYTVRGHEVNGELWTVNQQVAVSDAFLGIERDLLISAVRYGEEEGEIVTDISVCSAEAFDKEPVGKRRTNKSGKGAKKASSGPLDGTAEAL